MHDEAETTDVRAAHRFDEEALSAFLAQNLNGYAPPLRVRQFEGGQSNPTYLLEAGARRWVLRKKPPGALLPSAHQIAREYKIMHALHGAPVPTPRMELLCQDENVIGTEFFIMEWVDGRVFLDPYLPALAPAERRALYFDFIDVLARLHAIDPSSLALGADWGRPGNYFARQIARWSKQYQASRTHDIPEMDALIAWLPGHMPKDDGASVVHGDYSLRNCVIARDSPRIAGVLDWELSTIGHPLADVAYASLFYFYERSEEEIVALGIPSRAQLAARYFQTSGRAPVADWTFYFAFVLFRSAAINQGVYKRGLEGNASSETFRLVVPTIERNAARAWRLVREGVMSTSNEP